MSGECVRAVSKKCFVGVWSLWYVCLCEWMTASHFLVASRQNSIRSFVTNSGFGKLKPFNPENRKHAPQRKRLFKGTTFQRTNCSRRGIVVYDYI